MSSFHYTESTKVSERDRMDACVRELAHISVIPRRENAAVQRYGAMNAIKVLFPTILRQMESASVESYFENFSHSYVSVLKKEKGIMISCSSKLQLDTALYSFAFDEYSSEVIRYMAVKNPDKETSELLSEDSIQQWRASAVLDLAHWLLPNLQESLHSL